MSSSEGAYYGEDYDEYVTEWNGAIDDTVWAIGEGYLDEHLAKIVKAAIDRRKHLAEHDVVPALNVATPAAAFTAPATATPTAQSSLPTYVPPVGAYLAGWDQQRVATSVAAHEKSLSPWPGGFSIGQHYVSKMMLHGKVVRLQNTQNLSGYAVEIVVVMRSRVKVRLLEEPKAAGKRWRDAFHNQTLITVGGDALINLVNV